MKIAILGYSGSGKSTLARFLGKRYGIEVLHLDRVHWLPGWQERDKESKQKIIGDFLDGHTSWVIDGNYTKYSLGRRLEEADLIILLLFGRFACYLRALKRLGQYKGRSRPDMTEGCQEKVDWAFTKWIFRDGRTAKIREGYRSIQKQYPVKTRIIRNQRQLECFMKDPH